MQGSAFWPQPCFVVDICIYENVVDENSAFDLTYASRPRDLENDITLSSMDLKMKIKSSYKCMTGVQNSKSAHSIVGLVSNLLSGMLWSTL